MSAIAATDPAALIQQSLFGVERLTNGTISSGDDDEHHHSNKSSPPMDEIGSAGSTKNRPPTSNSPSPLLTGGMMLDDELERDNSSSSPLVGNLESHCPYCHKPYRKVCTVTFCFFSSFLISAFFLLASCVALLAFDVRRLHYCSTRRTSTRTRDAVVRRWWRRYRFRT